MPVPRRFDRRPPERDLTRVNERIRVPEVRLIDDEGRQVGVMKIADALRFAQQRELDLVEVAPEARPPVCRVLDYSKYKYEQAQKLKQARKHQQQITVREIKFRPKIAQHDYDTKKGHVERFLRHKSKVKVTIMFRGREVTHPERGTMILDRLAEELTELAVVEQRPVQEGRNMTMLLAPSKAVLAGRVDSTGNGASAEAPLDGDGLAEHSTPGDTGPVSGAEHGDGVSNRDAEASSQPTADAGAHPTADAGAQPDGQAGVQPDADADAGEGAQSDANGSSQPDAGEGAQPDANGSSQPDAHAGSQGDAHHAAQGDARSPAPVQTAHAPDSLP